MAGFFRGFGERFPYTNFHDLNLDWMIEIIKKFNEEYPDVMEEIKNRILKPTDNPNGNYGDYLTSNGDGTTSWTDIAPILTEKIYEAVFEWLDEHPEATTTVQDGSLTAQKFTDALKLETIKDYGTPEMYGAVGDGETDDTIAFQSAITNHRTVVLTNKYKLTYTIEIPSKTSVIFFGNSGIIANITTPDTPLFLLDTVSDVGFIAMGGAEPNITGVCPIVFKITGSDNFAISPANYSKFLRFKDLWITNDAGIGLCFYLETAVRQLVIDGCTIYCNNALYAHGKVVESSISNSILWGTATGGYAIKIDSALGSTYYNEGWTISNCTIDTSDKSDGVSFQISDFWVAQITNCYFGTQVNIIAPSTTTHSEDILFSNCVFYSFVRTSGQTNFHLQFSNCIFIVRGIRIQANASYVVLSDCTFKNGANDVDYAIVINNGCSKIDIHDIRIDSTFANGLIVNGATGDYVTIHDINYEGTGYPIYRARATRIWNVGMPNFNKTAISQGTKAVDDVMGTCTKDMVKGTNFMVHVKTTVKGGKTDGAGQILQLSVTKTDGYSNYIPFYSGTAFIDMVKVFNCSESGTVTATLKNYQGNSITTDYHDFIEIIEL